MRLRAAAVVAAIVVLAGGLVVGSRFISVWPSLPDLAAHQATIDAGVAGHETDPRDSTDYRPRYDPAGDYLGWSTMLWFTGANRTFDDRDVPMMLYGRRFEYNPITVAQFALSQQGKGNHRRFMAAATVLRDELMGHDGGFRFAYRYHHYLGVLEPGWTSAMAQGQALSVFARAYRIDGDPKWITAGDQALTFLLSGENGLTPSLEAIHPSLRDRHFFSEWTVDPPDYTLNGAMFTMLGLYDWSTLGVGNDAERRAARAWAESLSTLKELLPYYDMGRITAYDLSYLTYPDRAPHIIPKYHGVHGYLLHALVSITGDEELRSWLERWDGYFDDTP